MIYILQLLFAYNSQKKKKKRRENNESVVLLASFFHRKLRNNAFDNTLNMSISISQQLQLIDLQDNNISFVTLGSGYKNTLM